MNLPKFSVRYPVTVAMLMLTICILGFISFNRLGTDLLPSIYNPRIVVELQSDTPEDITAILRHKIRSVDGVTNTVTCTWI